MTVSEVRIGDPSEFGDFEAVRNPIDFDESQTLVLVRVEVTTRGPGTAELPARERLLYGGQQPAEAFVYREPRGSNPLVGPSLEPACEWRGYDLCYRADTPEGRERATARRWLLFVVPERAVDSQTALQLQVGQVVPEWGSTAGTRRSPPSQQPQSE